MSRTLARRSCTAVLVLGLALVAGASPASAGTKTTKDGTAIVSGGTLNGGTLNGGTLNGGTLNGGTLNGGTLNGGTLN